MESKVCKICKCNKDLSDFPKLRRGFRNFCKECYKIHRREYMKNYHISNKDSINEYNRKHRKDNKNYYVEYRERNRDKIRKINLKSNKKRLENSPILVFYSRMRTLIGNSIRSKGYKKKTKSSEILGCSLLDFRKYIESKFEPWMNWDNRGKYNGEFNFGWDIDHIIPVSSAKTEEEVIKLNHYTNLQPLCSKINRDIKKNNYEDNKNNSYVND